MPRRLSAAAIRSRIRKLENQAQRVERDTAKGVRAVAAVIAKYRLSLDDLKAAFSMGHGQGQLRGARRAVAVKYSDGKGHTWTGRGRTPLWLVAAEKGGKNRESFLVKK